MHTTEKELPQIRQITGIGGLKRLKPTPVKIPQAEETGRPLLRFPLKFLIIGFVFFSILGLELFIIYRYDKLYKRLYEISVLNKNKLTLLYKEHKEMNKTQLHVISDRNKLLTAYRQRNLVNARLMLKESAYRNLSSKKTLWAESILREWRVAQARIRAMKEQRDILAVKLKTMSAEYNQLIVELLTNIEDRKQLTKENARLKKIYFRLKDKRTQ